MVWAPSDFASASARPRLREHFPSRASRSVRDAVANRILHPALSVLDGGTSCHGFKLVAGVADPGLAVERRPRLAGDIHHVRGRASWRLARAAWMRSLLDVSGSSDDESDSAVDLGTLILGGVDIFLASDVPRAPSMAERLGRGRRLGAACSLHGRCCAALMMTVIASSNQARRGTDCLRRQVCGSGRVTCSSAADLETLPGLQVAQPAIEVGVVEAKTAAGVLQRARPGSRPMAAVHARPGVIPCAEGIHPALDPAPAAGVDPESGRTTGLPGLSSTAWATQRRSTASTSASSTARIACSRSRRASVTCSRRASAGEQRCRTTPPRVSDWAQRPSVGRAARARGQ